MTQPRVATNQAAILGLTHRSRVVGATYDDTATGRRERMAGGSYAPPLSARLLREDREWLVKFAWHEGVSARVLVNEAVHYFRNWQEKGKPALKELLETIDCACAEYEDQMRRLDYFKREYESQSRRLHNMRREYEKQLRRERDLRRACEQQIRRHSDHYEQPVSAAAEADLNALFSSKVAKLLALAVCSESDGEATAAFAKARAFYHLRASSLA